MTGVQLLAAAKRHCREHGIPDTSFGRLAVNDPRLLGDLRAGREPRPSTVARVTAFMAGRA